MNPFRKIFILSVCFSVLFSCKKNDYSLQQSKLNSATVAAMKEWLLHNGANYTSGKIIVSLSEVSNQTEEGLLNWEKAYLFKEDKAQYWYVPYYFPSGKYTRQNGEVVKFGLAFKIENKKVSEAMFSQDVYGKTLENLETGNKSLQHIQTYKPLYKSSETIVWKADDQNTPTRLYKSSLTKEQVMQKRNRRFLNKSSPSGGKGLIMSANNVEKQCETYTYTTTEDCTNYNAPPSDAVVVCSRVVEVTNTVCIDVPFYTPEPGTPPVGGGQGTPPAFPYNPGNEEDKDVLIDIDPCAKAKQAKELIEKLLNSGKFDAMINKLTEGIGSAKDEKWMGFGINTNGDFVPTGIKTGEGGSVKHNGYSGHDQPNTTLIGDAHTHISGLYNSHSAADIYALAIWNSFNSNHVLSLVYSADGSRNLLYIYDAGALQRFVEKYPKGTQVHPSEKGGWHPGSILGRQQNMNIRTLDEGYLYQEKTSDKDFMKANAALLSQFNTGIIMLHAEEGKDFKPIVPNIYQNPATGKYEYNDNDTNCEEKSDQP